MQHPVRTRVTLGPPCRPGNWRAMPRGMVVVDEPEERQYPHPAWDPLTRTRGWAVWDAVAPWALLVVSAVAAVVLCWAWGH
jgi:hypothetical protein